MRITIFLVLIVLTFACKYPDGPFISLRSKNSRIHNGWSLYKANVDGVDSVSVFEEPFNDTCTTTLLLYENNNTQYVKVCIKRMGNLYSMTRFIGSSPIIKGALFHDPDYQFPFHYRSTSPDDKWKIMKLTKWNFFIKKEVNNHTYKLEFVTIEK